jgi:hypothetical protein
MEMRRGMIPIEHRNNDTEEPADFWHNSN